MNDLVSQVVRSQADHLLGKVRKSKSSRIINDADLSSAFGIDMDDSAPIQKPSAGSPSGKIHDRKALDIKITGTKASGKQGAKKTRPTGKGPDKTGSPLSRKSTKKRLPVNEPVASAGSRKSVKPVVAGDGGAYETVVRIIRRRRVNGIGFQEIKAKTGFDDMVLRNIIQRARQKQDIQNQGRGLYLRG